MRIGPLDEPSYDSRRASYPPPVYAPAVPKDLTHAPPASLLRWMLIPAAAGVPMAVLWWLLAPGGALYGSGTDPMSWLPRDLVFAALGLIAGAVIGILVSGRSRTTAAASTVLGAVGGSIAGSLIAWQAGQWLGRTFTDPGAVPAAAQMNFSLLGLGALAIWPAAVALTGFIIIFGSLLRSDLGRAGR